MQIHFCQTCGNMVRFIVNSSVPMMCCGDEVTELVPKTTETGAEKHLPVMTITGDKITIQVGSELHPMTKEHHIVFVYLETKNGGLRRLLTPEGEPKVTFTFMDDKPVAVYAYCNLHGLWKSEIQ